MDMSGAMPVRAWLIITDRGTGGHLMTVPTEIDGGTLRTTVPAGLPDGLVVDLTRRLEWPDGSVTEDEPEPMALPAGSWIQIVEMG